MPYADPRSFDWWTPPKPVQLPDWRRKMFDYRTSPAAVHAHGAALLAGQGTLAPLLATPFQSAAVLNTQEADRLARGRLYYVDTDMTRVANSKATRPRTTPFRANRVPTRYGLMVFAEPIGSYRGKAYGQTLAHIPFVAVAWGPWRATLEPYEGPADPMPDAPQPAHGNGPYWRYLRDTASKHIVTVEDHDPDAYWITCYTPTNGQHPGPLHWDTEAIVGDGHVWEAGAEEGSGDIFVRATVAAWDLITQGREVNKPVADIETLERKPVKARQDRRRGIEDGGDVAVVSAVKTGSTTSRRPGSGTGKPYEYRRWVEQYGKSHCMNPRKHADTIAAGETCYHEDIEVLAHWAGDESLPVRETVHVLGKVDRDGG